MSFSLDPKFEVEKCRCAIAAADAVKTILEFLEKPYSEEGEREVKDRVLKVIRECNPCPVVCFGPEECVTKADGRVYEICDEVADAVEKLVAGKKEGRVDVEALKKVVEGVLALQLGCTLTFKPN